jgi:hypothetical protein
MNRVAVIVFAALCGSAFGQTAAEIMQQVQERSRAQSQHYEGSLKVLDTRSRVSEKRWTYDRMGSHGASKTVLRFTAPPEVKGVALLVVNHADRASDQWMWTPSINRERRIALQDRSTRFFGTDFSFEDLEERDVEQFDYKLLGEENRGGTANWKIESRPKKKSQYSHSYLWVRKDNYVLTRIEAYKGNKLVRSIDYSDIEKVQNFWTARKIEVLDHGRKSRTVLTLEKLQYNVPQKDENFTIQALRRES